MKNYCEAEVEIIVFNQEDIITTSGGNDEIGDSLGFEPGL